jgi:hypothetical protein
MAIEPFGAKVEAVKYAIKYDKKILNSFAMPSSGVDLVSTYRGQS